MWAFPVLVMLPRRSLPPLERSLGTTPMNAISSLGDRKRLRSMTSVMIVMAVMVSTPRSARNRAMAFPTSGLLDSSTICCSMRRMRSTSCSMATMYSRKTVSVL